MLYLENVSKTFGDNTVLQDIDLTLAQGEIICLLGASGSGKSTLLRLIAGLDQPDQGVMTWDSTPLQNIPIHERNFALIFQDFALFPHLNVFENVAFGLKMRHLSKAEIQTRVDDMLSLVRLEGFANRDVSQLSGGERQRVALARSLAVKPVLLMLDEPLGALDASLRQELAEQVREAVKLLGISALYVTHDQTEAYVVADRIAVLNHGVIEQLASPSALYWNPKTEYVARFLGFENIYSPELAYQLGAPKNAEAKMFLLHPAKIHFGEQGETVSMQVQKVNFEGERTLIEGMIENIQADFPLKIRFRVNSQETIHLQEGASVPIYFEPDAWNALL